MPWVVALATVPNLHVVYQRVSSQTALICSLCGAGWGIAVVLFGISVHLVGLSLASAIIYGASVAVGSLGPLVLSHSDRLATIQGMLIILGNLVMVIGIVLCALAGKKRDEEVSIKTGAFRQDGMSSDPRRFIKGLSASVAAAILSSLFNIALAYGGEFNQLAVAQGAKPINAANAQWAFTVTFGYLPNLVVSVFRLSRQSLWKHFAKAAGIACWLWPPVMGLMWIGGTALYGSGASLLGPLGPVIGWPVYMSTMILAGNFWGWLTGEWKQAPRTALQFLNCGILVQIVAITLLSAANR
jgi:L-rhamnose-H+ transport protein